MTLSGGGNRLTRHLEKGHIMKKDIIWLVLLTIGATLVYPDWIGLDYPLALEWIGFALLWVAIIWKAIDTIKEVAHDESKVRSDHRK